MNDIIKQVQEACAKACADKAQKALIAQVGDQSDLSNIMLRHHACTHVDCAAAIRALDLSWLSGWQPIETAPKDFVTEFDGWNGERVPNVSWARPS